MRKLRLSGGGIVPCEEPLISGIEHKSLLSTTTDYLSSLCARYCSKKRLPARPAVIWEGRSHGTHRRQRFIGI
jgi:hypothetical protein